MLLMCSLYRNEYNNLKQARPLWERDYEVVKRSGRDKPIWVVIHICMETTQEISLYSYLYLKLAKTPCFSYYLLVVAKKQHQLESWRSCFYMEWIHYKKQVDPRGTWFHYSRCSSVPLRHILSGPRCSFSLAPGSVACWRSRLTPCLETSTAKWNHLSQGYSSSMGQPTSNEHSNRATITRFPLPQFRTTLTYHPIPRTPHWIR
jgi:hypothetical protein